MKGGLGGKNINKFLGLSAKNYSYQQKTAVKINNQKTQNTK